MRDQLHGCAFFSPVHLIGVRAIHGWPIIAVRVNFQAALFVDVTVETCRVAAFYRIIAFKESYEQSSVEISLNDKALEISK